MNVSHPPEGFLQDTIDNLPAVFFAKHIDGRYIAINTAFEKLFNWERKFVIGKNDSDLFPKEICDHLRRNDLEVIESRSPKIIIETVIDYNGTPRLYESHKFPYFDKDGKVWAMGGIAIDVTDKVKAEEELEASRKMLLRTARMAAVGEMAGGIAHEINNPLAVIHAHQYLLRTLAESRQTSGTDWNKNLKSIEDAVVRIQKIVKGLLAFARQSSHDPKVQTSVSELLAELWELCRGRMEKRHINLTFPQVKASLKIQCRPYQISQILINLLNNAFDAVANLNEKWIRLEVTDSDNEIEFKVTDSGQGMPTEVRNHLFDSFFTTKEFGFGTGLGLSIAKGLAIEHGGDLLFDDSARNTTFVLRLPKHASQK